jgi:hypothetical protein
MMRDLTVRRYTVVLALACAVLAGCGSEAGSSEASRESGSLPGSLSKTSDSPEYSGHAKSTPRSNLSPTDQLYLTAGTEANPSDFEEVSTVVHGYLDARAEGDWELACSFVSPVGQRLLQTSAEKKGREDTSCPAILPRETTGSPEELRKEASLADVGSVHIGKGAFGSAFAIYRVADVLWVMIMSGEPGEWGIAAPNPVELG